MADISFNSQTIWSDSDGSYEFTPGVLFRRWITTPMLRAEGEIMKAGGVTGANHTLVLRFDNITPGNLATLMSKFNTMARDMVEGDLTIPDYGTYPHCVLTGITGGRQTAGVGDITLGETMSFQKIYNVEYTLIFHQARP